MSLLSIIIVNYKTPALLIGCLRSIYSETTNINYEVIVVDNASNDDSREKITDVFPVVKWIQMDYNAGFARANNAGVRQSSGDTVLLLNSDTIVVDRAIEGCYAQFSSSHFVACGVQLLNSDGSPQISGNYFVRGGLNNLLPLPYMGSFIKRLGLLLRVSRPHVPNASSEVEVDWINGAYLMVKKRAIEDVGLMDEDFFLYAEEAEWCYRLKKVGKLAIYGQFKVVHLQGETSNATFGSDTTGYYNLYDRKGLQIMVSNFVRIRKQFGAGWYFFHLLIYTITIPVFAVGLMINSRSGKYNAGMLKMFSRNVMKLWRLTSVIVRNKPYFYKVL